QEQQVSAGFMRDPLAETDPDRGFIKAPSLLQKYQNRALLITTPGCAINCRYCFRREFPYTEHRPKNHQEALTAIAADQSISEIILSGGDPLLLSDSQLPQLLSNIESIPHVQRIRIHSRIPIVLPERLTQTLMDTLTNRRCQIVMVVHSNHPQELNDTTARALNCLKQSGVTLLNQSVLLRDINDDVGTLVQLSEKLFTQGVLPYYLHLTDHVAGTEHFFVADEEAKEIYAQVQHRLPGYLLPKLVRELPGEASKTLLA
ncbi:MAG TPA: EF-P beta-lysylation protein EpmB, partial [Gammaproteobacteria bacterium]|nr:EF-P beta-lysylation protein EpmB [Gammaproteobacteria bacterium]